MLLCASLSPSRPVDMSAAHHLITRRLADGLVLRKHFSSTTGYTHMFDTTKLRLDMIREKLRT